MGLKAGKNLQETINFLIDQAIKRGKKKVYCTPQDLKDVIKAIDLDNSGGEIEEDTVTALIANSGLYTDDEWIEMAAAIQGAKYLLNHMTDLQKMQKVFSDVCTHCEVDKSKGGFCSESGGCKSSTHPKPKTFTELVESIRKGYLAVENDTTKKSGIKQILISVWPSDYAYMMTHFLCLRFYCQNTVIEKDWTCSDTKPKMDTIKASELIKLMKDEAVIKGVENLNKLTK